MKSETITLQEEISGESPGQFQARIDHLYVNGNLSGDHDTRMYAFDAVVVQVADNEEPLVVGNAVEGNSDGEGKWLPGRILCDDDGTYDIEYGLDVGGRRERVARSLLQAPRSRSVGWIMHPGEPLTMESTKIRAT